MGTSGQKLIGVISDTHGLVRPQAIEALTGVDMILHAGDIGDSAVLATLRDIAPVVAVRGNNDKGEWSNSLPDWEVVEVGTVSIYIATRPEGDGDQSGWSVSGCGQRALT